jgi:hypothetical protein
MKDISVEVVKEAALRQVSAPEFRETQKAIADLIVI